MKRPSRIVPLIVILVVPGCPGGPAEIDPANTVEVTGKVTLDGKPLGDAEICLLPASDGNSAPPFAAQADGEGNYSIPGVPLGEYKVTVGRMADGEPDPTFQKYQVDSPLKAQVTKEKTKFDFALTSGK